MYTSFASVRPESGEPVLAKIASDSQVRIDLASEASDEDLDFLNEFANKAEQDLLKIQNENQKLQEEIKKSIKERLRTDKRTIKTEQEIKKLTKQW